MIFYLLEESLVQPYIVFQDKEENRERNSRELIKCRLPVFVCLESQKRLELTLQCHPHEGGDPVNKF